MAQSELTRTVEPACRALAERFGYELVDVELAREGASRYLRVYIDKPDGITLNDCEAYHRALIPIVERVDYDFLEVCSPGLDRPLKKQRDFDRHAGETVEVSLYKPVNGRRKFEGALAGLVDGEIVLGTQEGEMRFPLSGVALCKPVIVVTEEDLRFTPEDGAEPDDATSDEEGDA